MYKEINKKKSKYETGMVIGYIITGISFIAYIPLGMAMVSSSGPAAFFLIAIPFIGGGLYASYNRKKIKEISNDFKKIYVTRELKKIFPDSAYYYDTGFSEAEVVSSGLRKKCDRYHSEDLIVILNQY